MVCVGLFFKWMFFCAILVGAAFSGLQIYSGTRSQQGYSNLAGFIPWGDASEYVSNAIRYEEQGPPLSEWGCRRPWHHLHLASLFHFLGNDLKRVLFVETILIALSILLSSWLVGRLWGSMSAVIFGALLAVYVYKIFFNTFLSESSGFLFGVLSVGLLLWSWRSNSGVTFFLSGLFMMLAMSARSGAFFILAACSFVLWWRRGWWRSTLYGLGVSSAILIGVAVQKQACGDLAQSNSNFAFSLYGMAKGGEMWTHFFIDYPMVKELPELVQSTVALGKSIELIKKEPHHFVRGFVRNLGLYLDRHMVILQDPWSWFEKLLVLGSFWVLFTFRADVTFYRPILFAAFLGLVVSAPFLVRDGHSRVLASAIGYYALIPAFAFMRSTSREPRGEFSAWLMAIFGLAILTTTLWLTWLKKSSPSTRSLTTADSQFCAVGSAWIAAVPLVNNKVNVSDNGSYERFLRRLQINGNEEVNGLMKLSQPVGLRFMVSEAEYKPFYVLSYRAEGSANPLGGCFSEPLGQAQSFRLEK